MKVAIGTDHGGYTLKSDLVKVLESLGHEVIDKGAYNYDADDDYPDFAGPVAEAVQSGGADRGIILCGSGVGACIAANKFPGVRAGLCHDTYSAHQGVEHDEMNVLSLGGPVIGVELAKEILTAFLAASFIPEARFKRRLEKLLQIEKRGLEGRS